MNARDEGVEKEHGDDKAQHRQTLDQQNPVRYPVLWERETQLIF